MTEQPEALRLADAMDNCGLIVDNELRDQIADELRRLHARDKEWESVTGFMQTTTDRMESELRRLHEENSKLRREVAAISANAVDDGRAMSKLEEQFGEAVWNYGEVKRINAQLLEALKMLVSYTEACEGLLNATPAGQVIKARAAIAAAKGDA